MKMYFYICQKWHSDIIKGFVQYFASKTIIQYDHQTQDGHNFPNILIYIF